MAVLDLFSKRQKRLRGELPEVYSYDQIPEPLRVQFVHVLEDLLQRLEDTPPHWSRDGTYSQIVDPLRREHGVFRLSERSSTVIDDKRADLLNLFLSEESVEKVLDGVEITVVFLLAAYSEYPGSLAPVQEAVDELNVRFDEHGVGFQLSEGRVVRVDSQYVHAEIVRPALRLLNGREYLGAQEEFMKAHAHFRKRENKDVLSECLKALESVMKSICRKRKWPIRPQATANELIDVCFKNGIVPIFWQSQFSGLRSILESGVPTGRNRLGGHGQGSVPTRVPDHIAAYVLHMTASAVVFLAEAEADLP